MTIRPSAVASPPGMAAPWNGAGTARPCFGRQAQDRCSVRTGSEHDGVVRVHRDTVDEAFRTKSQERFSEVVGYSASGSSDTDDEL